ncbi:MAG: ABC transporter ATP-binding protein [Coriobacteriia bacterium]
MQVRCSVPHAGQRRASRGSGAPQPAQRTGAVAFSAHTSSASMSALAAVKRSSLVPMRSDRAIRAPSMRYHADMTVENVLLELTNARVVRDGRTILAVEHLVIRESERIAILGPNGSGKSTLIGLLTRDVRPMAPEKGGPEPVRMLGKDRIDLFEARRLLGVVSFDLQEQYDVAVSVLDTVVSGYFGSVGLYRHQDRQPFMRDHALTLLESLGIAHLATRTMNTLSTGEARRALIARALVHDPRVLVLDEPCSGLDPGGAYHVREAVRELARQGRSVVLVTHHVDDIVPEIERVVMLSNGRIAHDGAASELLSSANLSELFGVPARVEERDGWRRMW